MLWWVRKRGLVATVTQSGASAASPGKEPRTARGRETLRKLLDAAAKEFGELGFHASSISGITRRAGTALGSFYTYFDSKEAIFSALVKDEAEVADPDSYRAHYEGAAARIAARLDASVSEGRIAPGDNEVRAWAIMGMNVILGLRYGVWDDSRPADQITAAVETMLREGIAAR